jgi:Spy/CpxP family protein refolding chaperone
METKMSNLTLKTMIAALLAASFALTAGGMAFAENGAKSFDPARVQQRLEKRVDRALSGTDATADQRKKIAEILKGSFDDTKVLRDKRIENRKAMAAAMQAPTIDRMRIEALRQEQLKLTDESSRRFTKAMADAGDVLTPAQRQAFFSKWGDHQMRPHGGNDARKGG